MITSDFTEKVVGVTGGGHDSCLGMERSNEDNVYRNERASEQANR